MPAEFPHDHPDVPVRSDRVAALAGVAHESLTGARTATLLVEGIGRVGAEADGVTLAARRGRPVLLCPTVGTLAATVGDGCAAVLAVPTAPQAGFAGTVVFFGRLHQAETCGIGTERTTMVEMTPESIVIESGAQRRDHVDLASYSEYVRRPWCGGQAMSDEEIERVAEQMRVHTNTRHGDQLIRAVVGLTATDPADIAGAALSCVHRGGVTLEWTDAAGGHRLPLSFTRPAAHPVQLAAAVRAALEGSR